MDESKTRSKTKGPNVIKLVMPDNKTPSQRLKGLFQILKEEEVEPLEWITETACKAITSRVKTTYFVVDPFEGEAYENLKSQKCFVVGAQVVIQCLKDSVKIPRCDYPVLHTALRGAIVSVSGIREAERDHMYERIRLMYGRVEKSFTADVTHLVTLTTGASSKKYIVAAEKGIPILSPKWLDHCWEAGKNESFDGTREEVIRKFRCPLFEGMKFCASGYDLRERNFIKETVISEGATYSGDLKLQNCSHLIVKEPSGQKFQCAQKWKIRCISIKWIEDSVAKGYCQDENNYLVEGGDAGGTSSTPDKKRAQSESSVTSTLATVSAPRFSVSSDISVIDASHVNETLNTTVASSLSGVAGGRHSLDLVDVAQLTAGKTAFLDGCKIYVCGLAAGHAEKCAKLINAGGASRFSTLSENVTHVILDRHSPRTESDLMSVLEDNGWNPTIVLPDWLIECARQGKSVPEGPFLRQNTAPPEEEVAEDQFLKPKVPVKRATSSKDIPEGPETTIVHRPFEDDDIMTQYGSQKNEETLTYKASENGASKTNPKRAFSADFESFDDDSILRAVEKAEVAPASKHSADSDTEKVDTKTGSDSSARAIDNHGADRSEDAKGTSLMPEGVDSQESESQETIEMDVFKGLRIAVLGFDDEDSMALAEIIEESQGIVVLSTPTTLQGSEADYLIVPLQGIPTGAQFIRAKQTTTSCWVQMCTESQVLLPVNSNPMFSAFDFDEDDVPLKDCVITVTGYTGVERENIQHLSQMLGAHVQELFARKPKGGKDASQAKANTHLICQTASGQKYTAAKKWNIPAVSARWLFACARRKKLVPIAKYDIDAESAEESMGTTTMTATTFGDAVVDPAVASVADPIVHPTVDQRPTEELGDRDSIQEAEETFALNDLPPSNTLPIGRRLAEEQCDSATPTILRSRRVHDVHSTPNTPMQTTTKMSHSTTPGVTPTAHHPRVAHLRKNALSDGAGGSPKDDDASAVGEAEKRRQSGTVTPARFMDPNVSYHPDFDFNDFLDELNTPEPPSTISPTTGQKRKHARKHSIPVDVLYEEAMKQAIINTQGTPDWKKQDAEAFKASQTPGGPLVAKPPPLQGVIIAVSKKLGHMQEKLNSLALDLGAEYRWTFDQSCTHFIYQGKSSDCNKEIKTARNLAKYIVCPEWLHQCLEEDKRLDEDQFPYTFDGKKNLGTVLKGGASPANVRSTRSSARTTTVSDSSAFLARGEEVVSEKENDDERTKESLALERCAAFIEATKQRRQSLLRSRNESLANSPAPGSDIGSSNSGTTSTPIMLDALAKTFKKDSPPTYEGSMPMGIGWEDPTEKAEREKMASKIRDVCQQTQGFVSAPAPPPEDTFGGDTIADSLMLAAMEDRSKGNVEKSVDKPVDAEEAHLPETVEILKEMADETHLELEEKKVFQFSGLTQEEKEDLKLVVETLGGELLESSNFEYACTHLIVKQPARNEKFLACVASGRWVLSKSYLVKSQEADRFLPETDFEWGSPSNVAALESLSEMARNLASSAHSWRKRLHDLRAQQHADDYGAFIEPTGRWKVLLITDKNKEPGLVRLLEAGGGQIIATELPFTDDVMHEATHALLDERRLGENKDVIIGLLKSLDVKVFKPEYIPAFLQGAADLEQYSLVNGVKRKAEPTGSAGTAPNSKRGRLSTRS